MDFSYLFIRSIRFDQALSLYISKWRVKYIPITEIVTERGLNVRCVLIGFGLQETQMQ